MVSWMHSCQYLPTSYYFDLNKALAISEWENLFGAISAGPIDINDQVEETLDAYLFRLIWNLL